ncbi:MAG TPA: FtsX-like permease family protein [Candidatus Limnocylindrales bacterium]|nr:FtsX-like permease family protein [Candidatus Limnocylindrales bacterium]
MIRFGLRLAVAGGRAAVARLVIIASAVALGVALLLAVLASVNALNAQFGRYAWMSSTSASADAVTADSVWWLHRSDYFDGQLIERIDVAATGPGAPVPPGILRLPGPGEFYASPALSEKLSSTPAAQLAERFPGNEIGTIGSAALPSPGSLVVVIGHTPGELSQLPGAERVSAITTTWPGIPTAALNLILSVVGAGLLLPVLIFIAIATRLSAARREQRFAAMRLLGATPRQISTIAVVESTTAAVVGTAAGFGLFFLLRPAIAALPFTGQPFYPHDLSIGVLGVALVMLGVPASAAITARVALRRVRISPLGVVRRVTPRPPRAYRLIPMAVGMAELAYFIGRVPETSNGQMAAFLPGFVLIMLGLFFAGPWLTMVGARALARHSSRPATLIAARRLADNPQAAFRAISGVVLALFVTSVATGVITSIVANRGVHRGATTASTLIKQFDSEPASVPETVTGALHATRGVQNVTVVRVSPAAGQQGRMPGLASCADLARAPAFGRCPDGAAVAEVWPDLRGHGNSQGSATIWPAASLTLEQIQRQPVQSIVVGTDGSTAALEQARTILEVAYPDYAVPPAAEDDFNSTLTSQLAGYQQLANVVILASLPIAASSLAVSVVGSLSDRKRPFSLLRLTGVQLRVLRRVVALESAVPLLVVSLVAIGLGFAAAHLFLSAQMDYTLQAPPAEYYIIVIGGLAASLGVLASTLPLLERITGPETARNE